MSRRQLRDSLLAALPPWIAARLLVLSGLVVATIISRNLTRAEPLPLRDDFHAWDAAWYREIAEHGYEALPPDALRFFPLQPLLGRAVGVPLLGNVPLALLLVANVAALLAGALAHHLVRVETGDEGAARRAAWYVALFPPAFVLVWGYAEPVLLLASMATFIALRRRRWGWAAVAGALAGLSRPLGIVLVVPAAVEAMRGLPGAGWDERGRRLVAVAGPALGAGAFLLWAEIATGSGWAPIDTQSSYRGDDREPVTRLLGGLADLAGSEALGDGLHIPFAIGLLALLAVCARRLPASYTAFAGVIVLIALAAENLNSLERYGLNAFPLVLALGLVTRHEMVERLALVACAGGLLGFTTLAWLGVYVP